MKSACLCYRLFTTTYTLKPLQSQRMRKAAGISLIVLGTIWLTLWASVMLQAPLSVPGIILRRLGGCAYSVDSVDVPPIVGCGFLTCGVILLWRKKSRKIVKLGLALVLVVLVTMATVIVEFFHQTTVLEWRFVFQPQITAVKSNGQPAIQVSGFSGHSALAVKDISVRRSGKARLVTVRLFLVRRGTTGNFQVYVPVEDGINEIRFGKEEVLIWQRGPA